MDTYCQALVNYEQNQWATLLSKAEFTYNNTKNTNSEYIFFELNCTYHPHLSYKDVIDPHSKYKW